MFTSIVAAVDLARADERALEVARSLAARAGLPAQVVTIASSEESAGELRQRARALGVDDRSIIVLDDDVPARSIAAQVDGCDGSLLVMATSARSALGFAVGGSVSEEVLARVRQPVLLVGPNVRGPCPKTPPSLVACVDGSDRGDAALAVIEAWAHTFGGGPTRVVEVVPDLDDALRSSDDDDAGAPGRAYAERLAAAGVAASSSVLRGSDPVALLGAHAERTPWSVLVVTSERWPGASHWHGTARKLARRSPWPVLVVPADRAGLPTGR